MYRASHPMGSLGFVLAWAGLLGCGGSPATAGPEARPVAQETAGDETEPDEAPSPVADAEEAGSENESTLLDGLHEGDSLTYRVHRANGEELDVRMRISTVIERGGSTAVQLSPMGTELSDTTPIFPHWVIGNEHGLFGLEEHVTLTEPGFVPLDEEGEMVTEAASNVAWHVPPEWWDPAQAAFNNDPVEGWTLAGHRDLVEGTVRGEQCVELEREEGELRHRMLVCANIGMVESAMSGATDEDPFTWRLVDLGGPRSPQLQEN